MRKIVIKVKQPKVPKETPEERAERIRLWQTTRTRVVPNKKAYNRKKVKQEDYRNV